MNRRHLVTLSTLLLLTFSCKPTYIFTQSDLSDYPCGTKTSGVNVRIMNTGRIPFSKFILKTDGKDIIFSGLKPGEKSCYKNLPFLWTNNPSDIWFYSDKNFGRQISSVGIDHIGESKIDTGFLTLEIKTSGTFKKPEYTEKLVKE